MRLRLNPKAAADDVPPPDGDHTIIAPDARFDGTLDGHVDVGIAGVLTGSVRGRTIAVGPRAEVNAVLRAYVIDIAGRVGGRIEAITVNVAKTAVVDATIVHHRLHVEDGAEIRGLRPWRPADEMTRRCREWTYERGPPPDTAPDATPRSAPRRPLKAPRRRARR